MNARMISAVSFAVLALVSGCAASSDDAADSAQDLSSTPAATQLADATALKNASFQTMRTFWNATTFSYADIQGSTAFTFTPAPAMSDADGLVLAKAIAKTANFGEVKQYTLNAEGTPTELAHLAASLEQQIRGDRDDTNTPTLTAEMLKAFALSGKAPGVEIKVFVAIGPGDDHDGDNQDREAIFLDTKDGEAVVLQGQSIDM